MENKLKKCALDLYNLGAFKVGDFTLKSGAKSPFYVDLRVTISYPKLLTEIGDLLYEKGKHLEKDLIVGVPYTALFFATILSIKGDIPMVMRRKEKKEYGTKKKVEGVFEPNKKCLVVEDVVTSGLSILETIADIEESGLIVKDIVCIIDREAGAKKMLEEKGYRLHSLFTITSFLKYL